MAGSNPEASTGGEEEKEEVDADIAHTNVIFPGTLPAATGSVPGILHGYAIDDLRAHAV
eukprot:CAMPEP_0203680810 /NCGR_PEP_ID=MMETSP0090-20130426/40670_1 /ASSEMBLY_ACC=CAM_ASM_001088 /TAXON_ID=426623 /ORGANISM="Chaetoceros affinis, Strain CCMP159" /LENGTH=58 /DNA_ID=CAMNT_0050549051 /DNA_START=9 /DNA_END=181 /DNA_ORIENTATION=-